MKKTIRMNERELHKLISESVRDIFKEAGFEPHGNNKSDWEKMSDIRTELGREYENNGLRRFAKGDTKGAKSDIDKSERHLKHAYKDKRNALKMNESKLNSLISKSVKRVLKEDSFGDKTFHDESVQSNFKQDTIDMLASLDDNRFMQHFNNRLQVNDPDILDALWQEYVKRKHLR